MDRGVRALVIVYLIVLAGACVYVPWTARLPRGMSRSLGYAFLWSPPQDYVAAAVDLSRILLELLAVTALFVGVFIAVFLRKGAPK
jgi:hypothetical protein